MGIGGVSTHIVCLMIGYFINYGRPYLSGGSFTSGTASLCVGPGGCILMPTSLAHAVGAVVAMHYVVSVRPTVSFWVEFG
jgi:hypothetical protein